MLRQDDGFGIEVIRRLEHVEFEGDREIKLMEAGTGGIHLVQELHEGYDLLVIVDAVQWGGAPGEVFLREIEVEDLTQLPAEVQRDFLADMHYTNPMRALMLARALSVIPEHVYMLGCEAVRHDDFEMGLSPEVEAAIPEAINRLVEVLPHLGHTREAKARDRDVNGF